LYLKNIILYLKTLFFILGKIYNDKRYYIWFWRNYCWY
jgi:hypothetical protein